jgi:hypothetical protein
MKIYSNVQKKSLFRIALVCLMPVALSSCLKTNNSSYYNPPVALVTLIQASPDEPSLDFYLDNDKVNGVSLGYGSTIDYFRAYARQRNANFFITGTMNRVFTDTITFLPNYIYSVFLANKASSPELVKIVDTLSQPATGKASIRFVNVSPDAPAVDLVVKGGAVVVSNKSYKGHSSFVPITGETTYTFEVHQAGTATVLATLPTTTLKAGFVYTIWLQGLATPTNGTDGLSANIMTNAFY